jgi:hypothetical protein
MSQKNKKENYRQQGAYVHASRWSAWAHALAVRHNLNQTIEKYE